MITWQERLAKSYQEHQDRYIDYMKAPYDMYPVTEDTIKHVKWLVESMLQIFPELVINKISCNDDDGGVWLDISHGDLVISSWLEERDCDFIMLTKQTREKMHPWHHAHIDDALIDLFCRYFNGN